MRQATVAIITVWINTLILTGCASNKSEVFGEDMPSMKEIHAEKFLKSEESIAQPARSILIDQQARDLNAEFYWLPNPTLSMYVFRHLSPAGNPVPGYSTFFKLYDRDYLATPGEEHGGADQ